MIKQSFARIGILLSFLALLTVPPAAAEKAEVIAIKSGTFVFEGDEGRLDVSGSRNFKLNALVFLHGGFFGGYDQCQLPECPPGMEVDLTARWSGLDVFGSAELRGRMFPTISSDDVGVVLGFTSSVTLPPMSDGPETVSVPFEFAGTFGYDLDSPEPKQALLTGGGTATLTLVPHPEPHPETGARTWLIQKIEFTFEPVENR